MQFLFVVFILLNTLLFSTNQTLDEWRKEHHLQILEGHVAGVQAEQFRAFLKSHPEIKSIMEIGLNGGHSADIFFETCPNIEKFISFDIAYWPYVKSIVEYFTLKHKNVFGFVEGDSKNTIPAFAMNYHDSKFDLIFIDGNHTYEGCINDITNCKALAHKNTFLLIDDYSYSPTVRAAILNSQKMGIIAIDKIHTEEHGWVVAHYVFK